MDKREALRPYVEQVLRDYLGIPPNEPLHVDDDGDIPVRSGSALYWVTLLDLDPVLVRVWSIVLTGVERSPELLEEINDINAGIVAARVFLAGDRIIAATELRADTMDHEELEFACNSVGHLADWIDTTLQVRFGGEKHFVGESDE